MLFQFGDEGQEELAVETVLVEIVGCAIGGCDDENAARPQLVEEAAEDHGVRRVLDLEFVEAQKARRLRDALRRRRDRIVARRAHEIGLALAFALGEAAPASDLGVDFLHEGEECTRRFGSTGAAAKNMSISIDLPRPTPPKR